MKNALILILIFSMNSSYGQHNEELYSKIDSFFMEYESNQYKRISCLIAHDTKSKVSKLSDGDDLTLYMNVDDFKDDTLIVDYIEKKYLPVMKYQVRKGIYRIYGQIIYAENLKIHDIAKEKITLFFLNNSFLGIPNELKYLDESYFNEEAKQRIRDILTGTHSMEMAIVDLQSSFTPFNLPDSVDPSIKNYYTQKAKRVNMTLEEWGDSVNSEMRKEISKPDMKEYKPTIHRNIIYMIGNMDFREYSTELEKLLDSAELSSLLADDIRLVLAKFNYKDYQEQFFEKTENRNYNDYWEIHKLVDDLRYIGTQNSAYTMSIFLYSEHTLKCECEEKAQQCRYYMLYTLSKYILNFPFEIYRHPKKTDIYTVIDPGCFCRATEHFSDKVFEEAHKWMKDNKGSYILSEEFYKKK